MPIINLLSYNSLQKPLFVNEVKNEYKSERNIYFASEIIEKFDIIALQEQFTFINPRPPKFLEIALKKGFNYYYQISDPPFTSGALINGGLMIISRYPILEADELIYDPPLSRDKVMMKGVIWTLIQLPNGTRVHVFNTHCLAIFDFLTEKQYIGCRIRTAQQICQLRAFITKKLTAKFINRDLALLCSDLNIDARNDNFISNKIMEYLDINEPLNKVLFNEKNELKFFEHIFGFNNKVFKMIHTFFNDHNYYPITVGDYKEDDNGNKIPIENIITVKELQLVKSNPDHVYELKVSGHEDRSKLWIKPKSTKVEEFFVKDHAFTQLSDHFGLSLQLEYVL